MGFSDVMGQFAHGVLHTYRNFFAAWALDTGFSHSPPFAVGLLPRMAKFTQRHCRAVPTPNVFYEDPVCNGTITWLNAKLVSEGMLSIRLSPTFPIFPVRSTHQQAKAGLQASPRPIQTIQDSR